MDLNPIFRKVVLGAAEGSLDVAGSALLPGAWPILKSALQPVLDRLKERLGGKDVTSSPELAQKAIEEFQADRHLQEIFRSRLLEQLDDLVQHQAAINGDVQKLMLIVTNDQKTLNDVLGGVQQIQQRLEEGVNLSDAAVRKLTEAISEKAATSRGVRELALSELGPGVMQVVQDQVHRLQIRADELLRENAGDRALDELQAGVLLVAALLKEAPTDIMLRLQLGFIYKTIAQVFDAAGDQQHVSEYVQRAEEIFRYIKDDAADNHATALDVANAIHGLGNVAQQRGDFADAIDNYKLVTTMLPEHYYAWHDMFGCYVELARKGDVNVPAMRNALDRLKETGTGKPGLGADYIAQLEGMLQPYEKGKPAAPAGRKPRISGAQR